MDVLRSSNSGTQRVRLAMHVPGLFLLPVMSRQVDDFTVRVVGDSCRESESMVEFSQFCAYGPLQNAQVVFFCGLCVAVTF